MKEKIKNDALRELRTYVPASVKVIEVTAQKIICQSGGSENSGEGDTSSWWTN